MKMHPLIDPEFHNVAVIKTRTGIRANPAMTDSLCWNCATANGCDGLRENCDNGHHYDLFTCPSCRRMVPWSSGGTDSLDCADCWALTEERKTMEEKTKETNEEAAPKLPKGPYVKTLWMLRAFDRNGNEDNRGDNQEAMAVASQLEATLEKGPASGVILIRDDLDDGSRKTRTTPTVVAFRTDADTNEVVATLHKAIDIALGSYRAQEPAAAPPKPDFTIRNLEFPGQTLEDKNKVPIVPRSSGHICGTCGHDQTVENPAVGVGISDLGTIRGSKIKSGTKALEKIIARQEKRIEELARENGNLACVLKSWEPLSERLLAATNSKGLSEAVAVAENVIAAYAKTRIVPVAKQE